MSSNIENSGPSKENPPGNNTTSTNRVSFDESISTINQARGAEPTPSSTPREDQPSTSVDASTGGHSVGGNESFSISVAGRGGAGTSGASAQPRSSTSVATVAAMQSEQSLSTTQGANSTSGSSVQFAAAQVAIPGRHGGNSNPTYGSFPSQQYPPGAAGMVSLGSASSTSASGVNQSITSSDNLNQSALHHRNKLDENEAKAAAQKKSRLLSLSLLGTATFIAIVAGVITGVIVYLASVNSLEKTALDKGEAILEGASLGVNELQHRLVMTVEQQANYVQSYSTPVKTHQEAVALYNETFFRQWSARIHVPEEIYSFTVRFFFPPVPDDQFIPQVKIDQLGCQDICARDGDPVYTDIASFSAWYDILANGTKDYFYAEPQPSGNTSTAYRLRLDDTPKQLLHRSERAFNYSTLSFGGQNGSFTDGFWFRPKLWTSSDGSSYYYFTHLRMFRHLNVSFVSNAFSVPHNWFNILKQLIRTSDKEFLLLTDGFEDRVLSFSGDKLGDKRLWNCSFAYDDITQGTDGPTKCADLSAKNHEHWFVKDVYDKHRTFIRSAEATSQGRWTTLGDGGRYLIISKEIFRKDELWVIATYAMHEDLALSDLESQTIPTVVTSAMIVVMASVFLAAVGYIMIRRTHKTVEIVAEVAFHISRYDIENGEEVLARSAAANDGNDALRGEFMNILENLKAYRAFLPAALQHPDPLFDSIDTLTNSSADPEIVELNPSPQSLQDEPQNPLATSIQIDKERKPAANDAHAQHNVVFAAHRLRTTRLRSTRGTVMLVSVGDISTKHAAATTNAINTFFTICIDAAKEHGGVVDNLSANGVLISFNYHVPCVKHEELACRCGLWMSERLNKDLAQYHIHAAIAISSGFNLVGTCGTEQQKSRVVVGEAVDMLQKINALQRRLNCEIVVSEQVAAATSYATAAIDVVTPSWSTQLRTRQMTLFQLRPTLKQQDKTASHINQAMQLIILKKPDEAEKALEMAAKNNAAEHDAEDTQVKRLLEVCRLQRDRILKGYSRAEIHWESMESGTHLDDFLTASSGASEQGDRSKYAAGSNAPGPLDDTERAKKELKQQQRAKEVKLEMKAEEEGESLFSIFVAEPKAEEAKEEVVDKFQIPVEFVDVHEEKWTRCEELIGRGQYGEVYTCISETGTLCALKAFPLSSSIDVDTLVKETEILQKMRHEHVAGYVSCAVLEHHFMIMMEYLAAGTLRKMIANVSKIPTRATYRYLQDVLHGLIFLHENDFAHCDLKPDNCLFAGDGTCKLADFGTAKLLTMESVSGMVRGTPRYMAPEAALGNWTMPADIYSIGIILIEMVTGKNPWSHVKGDDNTFLMRLSNDATMLPLIPEDMDPKLKSIAEDCLQRDPSQRPTAEELLARVMMV